MEDFIDVEFSHHPAINPNPDLNVSESESGRASLLQQLIDHWKTYFYKQSGEISEQDQRYIEKFAYELERDFLIDLVMNLTGKDMMEQGKIIKNLSKEDSFFQVLSKKSKPHMLQVIKSMHDSHLDYTVSSLHKFIHIAGEFYNMLYDEQLVREQNKELSSP